MSYPLARPPGIGAVILASFAAIWLSLVPALAQDATGVPPADSTATAAQEADAGPAYPPELDNASMPIEEFQLRLLPLTADQLSALAEHWQAVARDQTQAVVEATIAAKGTDGVAAQPDAVEKVVELTTTRGTSFARLKSVVDNLEKKGGDEATIAALRAYRSAILVEEKQRADWKTLLRQAQNWALSKEGGQRMVVRTGVIVGSFIALLLVARIVRAYARRAFNRVPNLSRLLQAFLAMVVYWITIAVGLMVVLSALGIDVSPMFAIVGGASFILAFAMQDTLGNLAAGLMIMFNRPFDEGDYITAAGTSGTVKSVSVFSTTVATPDNQVIVVPNSKVWGDVIINTNASTTRRVDMVFGIGYDDSIEEAQAVLEDLVNAHPMVLKDPAPVIRVNELADSSVNFVVRPWVRREDYFAVLWDLTRSVKEAFDARGISIPFPQTDMHIRVREGEAVPGAMMQAPTAPIAAKAAAGYAAGDDGAEEDGNRGG
ncbi:mechanosensitive ion channel family protein [Tropicimonas sp. IMCC34043]|uniref:mechanosensitive ion channel family protein n=1 Tax=Tropicimonas sp. IMCC34043 TaxID=2248760 RepID=UPI000E2845EE|nr:mechanosensitive ion channel family protein [Tropicimonas sp. IMCC34043]